MKKIILLIALFIFFISDVFAYDISVDPVLKDDKYILNVYLDDQIISYEEAIEKYEFYPYMEFYVEGEKRYFKNGTEITEKEYIHGESIQNADILALKYKEYGIRIHNTKEMILAIENIYKSTKFGTYHLVYSEYEENDIDFSYFANEFSEKYITDIEKNMYKYSEYGIMHPMKYTPMYGNGEIIVYHDSLKITPEEEEKVDEFLDVFIKEFDEKSDYEKILGIYTYLSKTTKYQVDDGYFDSLSALHSTYDVLIKRKMVCIGMATTFQFLAEKVGINSYIVDHVISIDESSYTYSTNHTYNIVELDGKWYIVDIKENLDFSGLLIGLSDSNYSLKDFSYYNISVENESYFKTHNVSKKFSFDYQKYDEIINNILGKKDISKKEEQVLKKDYFYIGFNEFLIGTLIVIFLIIACIIYLYVRR